jgi:DNA-binding CsgD family transcriptional regulator
MWWAPFYVCRQSAREEVDGRQSCRSPFVGEVPITLTDSYARQESPYLDTRNGILPTVVAHFCVRETILDSVLITLERWDFMYMTLKEQRIIALVAEGLKNSDIAKIIGTTENGIKNCMRTILDKTGMWSRLELALWYVKGNLMQTN